MPLPELLSQRTRRLLLDCYLDNGDGTVTDKETHLMWKRCLEGMKWKHGTRKGTASKTTWNDAMPNQQQKQLPKFAGYNDWRVPEIEQLKTLVCYSSGKPKLWNDKDTSCDGDYKRPTIAQQLSPTAGFSYAWSSSPDANGSNDAWGVYFGHGRVY